MGIKPINTESMADALCLARSQEIEGRFARPILVDWGDGVLKIENRDIGSDLRSLRESIWTGCRREQPASRGVRNQITHLFVSPTNTRFSTQALEMGG